MGLVALKCTGAYIGDYEVSAMIQTAHRGGAIAAGGGGFADPSGLGGVGQGLMPRNLKIAGVNEDELDATIQDKIRTLNAAKQ